MNESEFEDELRALRPMNPPPEIALAIRRELGRDEPPARSGVIHQPRESLFSRLLTGLCWAASGAAAALLAVTFLPDLHRNGTEEHGTAPTLAAAPRNAYHETTASAELLRAEDGGVVYDKNQQPAEILRYSSMERHSWVNPATGARVEVEVPREDVVLVPVSFQ